jgi:hypothetical protein
VRKKKGNSLSSVYLREEWFGEYFKRGRKRGGREKEEEIESQTRTWSQDLYF